MGLIGKVVGSAIAGAVSTAANAVKNSSRRPSGGSSGGSSGGGGGSSGGYVPVGNNTDAIIQQTNPADYAAIQQLKQDFAAAQARGDTQGMMDANNKANAYRYKYGYTGGKDGSEYLPDFTGKGYPVTSGRVPGDSGQTGGYSGMYGQAMDTTAQAYQQYIDAMNAAAEQERRAKEAAVQQAVGNLSAQKTGVQQAGAQANTAAEQAYRQLINPNGANAEALAARGLSASGLTESALIGAGNTYQSALNANTRSVNEQLTQIDRDIENARLTGDIENARLTGDIATAEALAAYRQAVAAQGISSASQLASLQMQQVADTNANALAAGQMLGTFGGQQTLAGKQLDSQITSQTIENQMAQLSLQIMMQTGLPLAQAQVAAQLIANQQGYENLTGTTLQNEYMRRQLR